MALPKGFPDGVLRASVTLSAADTYTQIAVPTGIAIDSKVAMVVTRAELTQWDATLPSTVQLQLTRKSAAAILEPDDPDVMISITDRRQLTTSGAARILQPTVVEVPVGFGIASPTVYFGADGDNGVAWTAYLRLWYYLQRVTEAEFRSIQTC